MTASAAMLAAAAASAALAGCWLTELREAAAPERVRVASVVDGDTITVTGKRDEIRVRLIGMDTPETVKPDSPVECAGPEASRALERALRPGTRVVLRADPTQADEDQFGRALRYVEIASMGEDVGLTQLKRGLAEVYDTEHPFARLDRYRGAADHAERRGAGAWGLCGGFEG